MTFDDIPAGTRVFIDANAFIFHFAPHAVLQAPCQRLLERVARHEIAGFTSPDVLSDVAHRLMTMEAAVASGRPFAGIAYHLKQHPAEIHALSRFRQSVEEVPAFGVQVLSIALDEVLAAAAISQQFGLLSGDALLVAVMQANGLTHLASSDSDFDRVPGLTRYEPA